MSSSRSRASTTTSTETSNVSRNLNIQDVEGITLGEAGGDVHLALSDQGAISAGEAIAREALLGSRQSFGEALGAVADYGAQLRAGFSDALAFSDAASRREREVLGSAIGLTERIASEKVTTDDSRVQGIARTALITGAVVVGVLGLAFLSRTAR